jgi:signal transduction histidine kinase
MIDSKPMQGYFREQRDSNLLEEPLVRLDHVDVAGGDEREQGRRLLRFLRSLRFLLFLCGTTNVVGGAISNTRLLLQVGLMMLGVAASTFVSEALLARRHIVAAAAVAAYSELALALMAGLLFPYGAAAVLVAALIAPATVLPYLEGRQLRFFFATSYAVVVAVLWRGFQRDPRLTIPYWLEFSAVVVGGAGGAYLLLFLLWQFSDRLRLTIEGTRSDHRQAEKARRSAAFLAEASRSLGASSLDYAATLRLIAQLVVPALADYCFVDELTSGGRLRPIASAHAEAQRQPLVEQLHELYASLHPHPAERVFLAMEPTITHDIEARLKRAAATHEQLDMLEQLRPRSGLLVPLVARGRTLGCLLLAQATPGPEYQHQDLLLAQQVATRAALVADNARLYAEAQTAVRARDEFLSIASHELKTPLTSLYLVVESVQRHLPQIVDRSLSIEWFDHRLRLIGRHVERLGRLVDELLDLSRLLAGKFRLEVEWVDLGELVREVSERLLGPGSPPPVRVDLDIVQRVAGRWDRLRVEQVFTNLLSNAMKYGAGRPIEVAATSNGRVASLRVTDHGVGIAVEDQRRIFERFERAASTSHVPGLGLGLFIALQIVEAMGGTIRVASAIGQGSTFTVELPLDRAADSRPT